MKKSCVYTVLLGNYESLNNQPVFAESSIDKICFTDDPDLKSKDWTISIVTPRFPEDQIRSSRYLKALGPKILSQYDESLYIDNSIVLAVPPEQILKQWLEESDLALPFHSFRESVEDEFHAVNLGKYDDPWRIYEQLIVYEAGRPSVLREKPYWTAFMARRHSKKVQDTMQLWYEHICRYSRRDQLSINHVLSRSNIRIKKINIDNHSSTLHRWPISKNRLSNVTHRQLTESVSFLNLEQTRHYERKTHEYERNIHEHNEKILQLQKQINDIYSSTSWRTTHPLRMIGHFIKPKCPSPEALHSFKDKLINTLRRTPLLGATLVRKEIARRYYQTFGSNPNVPPRTFNEYITHRILFDRDSRFKTLCDKVAVKHFIRDRAGARYVVPALGVWKHPREIPWDSLPDRFVLKPNHASGPFRFVPSASERDIVDITNEAEHWLSYDYFDVSLEWGYRGLPRRLIAEPLLLSPDGDACIEVDVFIFNGKAYLLRLLRGEKLTADRQDCWFDRNGNKLAIHRQGMQNFNGFLSEAMRIELLQTAESVAHDFNHMRVDFYLTADGLKIGELTPYNEAGRGIYLPSEVDAILGSLWKGTADGSILAPLKVEH